MVFSLSILNLTPVSEPLHKYQFFRFFRLSFSLIYNYNQSFWYTSSQQGPNTQKYISASPHPRCYIGNPVFVQQVQYFSSNKGLSLQMCDGIREEKFNKPSTNLFRWLQNWTLKMLAPLVVGEGKRGYKTRRRQPSTRIDAFRHHRHASLFYLGLRSYC